jgi:conjugative transposon TraM protein
MSNQTKNKQKLSVEQKQQMKKYAVFALMGVICAGCMWFIFAPSAEEKARQELQAGFNADIPDPKNEGIVGDKATAYEQEQMKQKQAERMRSLEDFSALFGENNPQQNSGDLALLTDESTASKSGYSLHPTSVQNSVNAYRDINRTLGSFYETPKSDPEKERLQTELDELRDRLDRQEQAKNSADEQMAMMEKSFQMASKYLPMNGGVAEAQPNQPEGTNATVGTKGTNVSGKTVVVPVSQVIEQTVSALPQEMTGEDVMQAFSKPRNLGFLTAATDVSGLKKNTVSACVHADQTVSDGEGVRLRLLEDACGQYNYPRKHRPFGRGKNSGRTTANNGRFT